MIGVVGGAEAADRVAAALEAAGVDVTVGSAERATETSLRVAVAVGEPALLDLVEADVDAPVLPVDLDDGLLSATAREVPAVIEAAVDGSADTRDLVVLTVTAAGEPAGRAVFEAMLVRSEPGRISEYSLVADAAEARFRADGVAVATPAGSHGYSHAAGGPRLGLDTGAVVVQPVAAFGLGAPTWVLDPDSGLELRVERDEGDVSLLVDGRERRRLSGTATVSIRPGGSLTVIERTVD